MTDTVPPQQGIEEVTADRDRLLKAVQRLSQPSASFRESWPSPDEPPGLDLVFDKDPAGLVTIMIQAFGEMLNRSGAINYLSLRGYSPTGGGFQVIIQRTGKLSPHEARKAAEGELRRAVALLAERGIPWDGPTEFLPDDPVNDGLRMSDSDWLKLDFRRTPNVLMCDRCGGEQPLPETATTDVFIAVQKAFEATHGECIEVVKP